MNEVTVAICVFNGEKYIEETLSCILEQTFQNFDLLIINDCSTDSTRQKIIGFFENNPRPYRLVDFEDNSGIAAGRHFVESSVATKYILSIDADDRPHPSLVEKLYKKIVSDDDLMAVGCYLQFIDSQGEKMSGGIFMGETSKEGFYLKAKNRKLIFMQPTAIIDREALLLVGGTKILGFPEGKPRYQDLCEDLDLWTRMSDLYTSGKAIVVVPEILCHYRKHEQGLSANSLGMILRMKHIKTNLLRRRKGECELTFREFQNSLTSDELSTFEKNAKAASKLRGGVFYLKKGRVFSGIICIVQSVWSNPKYFLQKVRSNTGFFKYLS